MCLWKTPFVSSIFIIHKALVSVTRCNHQREKTPSLYADVKASICKDILDKLKLYYELKVFNNYKETLAVSRAR